MRGLLATAFGGVAIGCAAFTLIELHAPLAPAVIGGVGGGPTTPIEAPLPSPSPSPSPPEIAPAVATTPPVPANDVEAPTPEAVARAASALESLAWKSLEVGAWDRARADAQRCVQAAPSQMSCRAALAVANLRTGGVDEAKSALESISTAAVERQVVEAELALADHDDERACHGYHAACARDNEYACRRERDLCGE